MCQDSLELHVLSHVVLGPLSDVTHLTIINHHRTSIKRMIKFGPTGSHMIDRIQIHSNLITSRARYMKVRKYEKS